MKFTQVLYKRIPNLRLLYKQIWKKEGKMPIAPVTIPPELQEMGVNIFDAKEVALGRSLAAEPKPSFPFYAKPSTSRKFYVFDNETKVTEREAQVGALTKTLCYEGLPHPLDTLVGVDTLRNQDELVQIAAMQALVRDGQMVKLPRKIDPLRPCFVFDREFGIDYERKSYNLMEKLAFLGEMACCKYEVSTKRIKILDAYTELPIERAGEKVIFQLSSDFLFASNKPLAPFATPEEVESTRDIELPSIYPIKPTLDLTQLESDPSHHVQNNTFGTYIGNNLHVHTLHMIHKTYDEWFPVQMLSSAIANCFCFASDQAKRLYGNDVVEIPRPISLQCVFSDVKSFIFVAYQLNTLDLENDSGIKNLAWYEGPFDLYEDVSELKGIQGYNKEVFPKMLALYMNGSHPQSFAVS